MWWRPWSRGRVYTSEGSVSTHPCSPPQFPGEALSWTCPECGDQFWRSEKVNGWTTWTTERPVTCADYVRMGYTRYPDGSTFIPEVHAGHKARPIQECQATMPEART